jgi:two-component system chemotaxis sensor kinase CheA
VKVATWAKPNIAPEPLMVWSARNAVSISARYTAFRALHTIKGSGAMFGFAQVATFTHDFETAFDGPDQALQLVEDRRADHRVGAVRVLDQEADVVLGRLHTIKGSGAMFGFAQVATFTHDFETAFDLVRQGERCSSSRIAAPITASVPSGFSIRRRM